MYFDLHHTVTPDEIDSQQHVHNLRYLQWTLWAAGKHVAATGFDAAQRLREGIGWVVRDHQITYRAAAFSGDELIIRTWITDVRRYAVSRKSLICRPADQAILAKTITRWVYVDLKNHKALSIPTSELHELVVIDQPPMPWG